VSFLRIRFILATAFKQQLKSFRALGAIGSHYFIDEMKQEYTVLADGRIGS
jgi:hypothetical protein